ncbi:ABC transporter permease [Embleya sp. NBC_00888]|uniref:FtsX-like permease family protein n=1 Tax=Embleya sp. NBC_00888 TaxID=2975960 RepID=UPI003863BA9D|nr:ABC transporter permease [Embleya sp. NBC_00888]
MSASLGALTGVVLCAVLTTVWGVLFESALRWAPRAERLAAADVVVDGDPWQRLPQPGGRQAQVVLSGERRIPAGVLDRVRAVPGARAVLADRPVYAQLVDRSGRPLNGPDGTEARGHAWSAAPLTPFALISGRPPQEPGELVVERFLAARADLRPGDRTVLLTAAGARAHLVVGIADRPGADGPPAAATVFLASGEAAELAGDGDPFAIGVQARRGVSTAELARQVTAAVRSPGIRVLSGAGIGEAEHREAVEGRDFALAVSASFGSAAALFAVFVVTGPLLVSVTRRRREIALLRAVGATAGQIRRMIAGEVLILTVVGVALGGLVGLLGCGAVADLFIRVGVLPTGLTVVRGPLPVLAALLLGVVGTQLAALFAARRAGRIKPAQALREAVVRPGRMSLARIGSGVLVAAAGGTLVVRTTRSAQEPSVPQLFAQVGVLLTAAALLGPVLVRLGARVLGAFAARVGRSPGRLARTSLRGDARTLSSIVVPLAVIVAFACAVVLSGRTLADEGIRQSRARLLADRVLVADGAQGMPAVVAERVRAMPGVAAVTPMVDTQLVVRRGSPVGDILERVTTRGLDPGGLVATLDPGVRGGTLSDLAGDTLAVSRDRARSHGWRVGDRVDVVFADGAPATLRVVAEFERSLGFADLLVPHELASRHLDDALDQEVLVTTVPGPAGAAARAGLGELRRDFPTVLALDRDEAAHRAKAVAALDTRGRYLLFGSLVAFAAAAAATALLIGAAGRARELGLLRLIGATRGQLLGMVGLEWIVLCALAIVLGLAVVAVPLAAFSRVATHDPWPSAPAPLVLGILAAVAFLALVSSVFPAACALRAGPLTREPSE